VTQEEWRVAINELEMNITIDDFKRRVAIQWQIEIVDVRIVGKGRVTRERTGDRKGEELAKP